MNKISCEICMDLLPLVEDGVAGEESCRAVEEHLAECSRCRSCREKKDVPLSGTEIQLKKLKNKLRGAAFVALLFGIFFGLLQTGEDPFLNSILMPLLGALAYYALGWRALWTVPLLLCLMNGLAILFRGFSFWQDYGLLMWTVLYIPFALLGTALGGLYQSAFQKKTGKTAARAAVLVLALLLTGGIGLFANALVGNPVSKLLVTGKAKSYVAEIYPDTDYEVTEVSYSFKTGGYYAKVTSDTSIDGAFALDYSLFGQLQHSSYEDAVLGHDNTERRLYQEYRSLGDRVLKSPQFPYWDAHLIAFTDLQLPETVRNSLEQDKAYNIPRLGAEYGSLVISLTKENISTELAAEILLETKKQMDEAGVPFRYVDFMLSEPNDAPNWQEPVWLERFPAEDIEPGQLAEKIEQARIITENGNIVDDKGAGFEAK